MSRLSRIIIAIVSLGVASSYFLPVWFIYLIAPQYPEGLTMNIWLNRLSGDVEIINGLNHYIGMKKIDAAMFPELKYLVYAVALYIVSGLAVAITGSRKLLLVLLVLTGIGGIAAMVDMYQWGYNYGHNLDPTAPIQVPGLSYQPPLFGHKKLLNFDAYSYPAEGGWVVIGAALVYALIWFLERKKKHTSYMHKNGKKVMTATSIALLLIGCSAEPQKIDTGKDLCDECKMNIMDSRFGSEIVTKKGKVFKFDDAHCLVGFIKSGKVKQDDIANTVVINYNDTEQFLDAGVAAFVVSPQLKSPMNSNAVAFPNKATAEKKAAEVNGQVMDWNTLYNSIP